MPALRKRITWLILIILLAGFPAILSCAGAPAAVEVTADGALVLPA